MCSLWNKTSTKHNVKRRRAAQKIFFKLFPLEFVFPKCWALNDLCIKKSLEIYVLFLQIKDALEAFWSNRSTQIPFAFQNYWTTWQQTGPKLLLALLLFQNLFFKITYRKVASDENNNNKLQHGRLKNKISSRVDTGGSTDNSSPTMMQ